jgi:hypothetical protein
MANKITLGFDFNFYKKIIVTNNTFSDTCDAIITFATESVMFLNENNSGIVEYSFNGNAVHGELDPSLPSRGITFDNRVVSKIWFKIKDGSSGPVTIRVDAWATR